jgi:hypothetical protein
METDGWVDVQMPKVQFLATPNMKDPSDWKNHFYSSDDLLNRIWYGCGYTTQMCSINPSHGRQWPAPASGWNNSATCGIGDTVLVDGAKRDRVIWPGDMGVSSLTAIATTGDLEASRNALNTLFKYQLANGMLPYAGPPVDFFGNSDTYHLWALIGTFNVASFDASPAGAAWLKTVWPSYVKGVAASTKKVKADSGLFDVTAAADWARGGQGGENCPANMLYYHVLTCSAALATKLGDSASAQEYTQMASTLRVAIMKHLWDPTKGAFWDNTNNHKLYPQDGNSLAVWFNVTTSDQQSKSISDYLLSNWGEFGSSTPEWHDAIGTFPGSMEVHAHMAAGQVDRAHELMKLQWGYMLDHPQGTESTFWEGYNKDGSFAYQGIYMSNAHGWATGPAAALTFNTLGVRAAGNDAGGEAAWVVRPQFGDLSHCGGRLGFAPGAFVGVAWNVTRNNDDRIARVVAAVDSSTMSTITSRGANNSSAGFGKVILDVASLRDQETALIDTVTVNGVLVWRRGLGSVCEVGSICGIDLVGSISVLGVRAGEGTVAVENVLPQHELSLSLTFV